MRVQSVSGDMLAKLAIAAAVLGAGWWGLRQVGKAVAPVGDVVKAAKESAGRVADAVVDVWVAKPGDKPEDNWAGMPAPEAVSDDPRLARYLIDQVGTFEASKWCTLGAMARAVFLDSSEGRAPAPGSEVYRALGLQVRPIDFPTGDW